MIILEKDELEKLGVSPSEILKAQRKTDKKMSIKKEVDENAKATLALANAIKQLANQPKSHETVQDMAPIIEAIYSIQETQLNVLQLLEKKIDVPAPKPKSFDFFIARNKHGSIHKITARETTKDNV